MKIIKNKTLLPLASYIAMLASVLLIFFWHTNSYPIDIVVTRLTILGLIGYVFIGTVLINNKNIDPVKYVVFFLAPLITLIYASKGFSEALTLLHEEHVIIPCMRASVTYIILSKTGHLDMSLDYHLRYIQEYFVVYIVKIVSGITLIYTYELVMKLYTITIWMVLSSLLLLRLPILKSTRSRSNSAVLVSIIPTLLTFLPSYASEMGLGYPLMVLMIYFLWCIVDGAKNLSTDSILCLILLVAGVVFSSQRQVIVLFIFSVLVITVLAHHKTVNATKIRYLFLLFAMITFIRMFFDAALYTKAYVNYVYIVIERFRDALLVSETEIKRIPLHTILSYTSALDIVLNTLGSLSLFTLIALNGIFAILYLKEYLVKVVKHCSNTLYNHCILGVPLALMLILFETIIGIAYLLNVLGMFNLDFETTAGILSTPSIFVSSIAIEYLTNRFTSWRSTLVWMFLLGFILLAPLGLPLKTPIKSYCDVFHLNSDPIEMTYKANSVFRFVTSYYIQSKVVMLDPRFSSHYLLLPFKYVGIPVVSASGSASLPIEELALVYNYGVLYSDGSFKLLDRAHGFYLYDGRYVIMPYLGLSF